MMTVLLELIFVEPESNVIDLCEYNHICELDSKPELISYWVRDSTAWVGRGKEEVIW